MAWEILKPSEGARGGRKHLRVTVALRRTSGNTLKALVVTASSELSATLGWKPKEKVQAQVDRAAGLLRLVKAADGWSLTGKGHAGLTAVQLRFAGLPEGETYPAEPAEYRIEDGALILTLPAWVFPAAPVAKAPPPVVPPVAPPVAAPAPARPAPPPPKPTADQEKAEAIKMLEAGLSAREVSDDTGLPLGTVSTWAAEVRQRRQRAA
ncbi:hypothetical protein UFOVP78_45 [uncultured Caudovirales phage]|uniref:Uncharacterized protein n=1 Tax=uncultured Caudovirales phage TaxID=2100421 RepID=A0A6J5L3G4_9CAUD|nr:hypothetical protein UFOVP78_45 [uncultured Caudovirales phage]